MRKLIAAGVFAIAMVLVAPEPSHAQNGTWTAIGTATSPGRSGAGADAAVGADPAAVGLRVWRRTVMSTTPPPLAADLNDGLKRLKMAAMRRLAPELIDN